MFNLTPVVRTLLIINVLVFFVTNQTIIEQFGLHSFLSDRFSPIQIITHMFLHGGFNHIFSNMIGLIVFGPMLEQFWGPRRFTFFYFFCGIGAALLFSGVNYYETRDVYDAVQTYRVHPDFASFSAFIDQHAGSYYDRLAPFLDKFREYPTDSKNLQDSVLIINRIFSNQVDEPMVGASGAIFGVIMGFGLLFSEHSAIFYCFHLYRLKLSISLSFTGPLNFIRAFIGRKRITLPTLPILAVCCLHLFWSNTGVPNEKRFISDERVVRGFSERIQ